MQISTSEGLGSGIVFDTKGDIVTNAHVVGTATTVTVTTSTGKTFKGAKVVGTYTQDDLAVVNVTGLKLHPATFAKPCTGPVGDRLICDAGGAAVHQADGLRLVGGKVQIGEQHLPLPQHRDLLRLRLLHLDDQIG